CSLVLHSFPTRRSSDLGGSDRKIYEIELDRTAFFPEGGGQYADTGVLGEARVLDVRESDGRIIHYTDAPLETGARVKGCIAWERSEEHTSELQSRFDIV